MSIGVAAAVAAAAFWRRNAALAEGRNVDLAEEACDNGGCGSATCARSPHISSASQLQKILQDMLEVMAEVIDY